MGQQPNVEIELAHLPRPTPEPGPAQAWRANRPSDVASPALVPTGGDFGSPAPDAGFALSILAGMELPLEADERRVNVEWLLAHLMFARASRFGRSPNREDAVVAMLIAGLVGRELSAGVRARTAVARRYWAPRVAAKPAEARRMLKSLSEEDLTADADHLREQLAAGTVLLR